MAAHTRRVEKLVDRQDERERIAAIETTLRKFARERDVHVPRIPELSRVLYDEQLLPALTRRTAL